MIAYLGSLKASYQSYALESKVRARWPLQSVEMDDVMYIQDLGFKLLLVSTIGKEK